jgi:hypothetical protein
LPIAKRKNYLKIWVCERIPVGINRKFDLERQKMETSQTTPASETTANAGNMFAQLTIAKPAPVVPVVTTGKAKQASKPAKQASKAAPVASPIKYRILQGQRPGNGALLFAHTAAFLELSGMLTGGKVAKSLASHVLGDTAVKHHLNTTAFFDHDSAGLSLSAMGAFNPHWTTCNPEYKAAFMDILTTGKTTRAMPASTVNPLGIVAIK